MNILDWCIDQMSKKLFKKIAGGLYRDGLITIEPDGLRLVEKKIEP